MFNNYFAIISPILKKGFNILHNQFLQQQIAQEEDRQSVYNALPSDIRTTLDDMAFGIAQKEELDAFVVKQRMVSKLNMLPEEKIYYLLENMAILIQKSVHENEDIDDKNVPAEFITFLISLFY